MTYEQIVAKVKEKFAGANASKIDGVKALQINIEGKNVNGIFYIEVKDHQVNVEPYDYYDHNAVITANPTNLLKVIEGKLSAKEAYKTGKITVDGDLDAVLTVLKLAK
ncbi:MAG: SCP2 sterol-binding domain-containing protein [Clostridiales bacterium]|nr:SCP2 sterol-binding domain-containing protein [Clostridiales bacterium]